jgi:hypothetical protein
MVVTAAEPAARHVALMEFQLNRRTHMRKIGLIAVAVAATVWPHAARAWQTATPAETLAAQVRLQGHHCAEALNATRDTELSKPNEAVWVLKCANASYRLSVIPNMAAKVERLE